MQMDFNSVETTSGSPVEEVQLIVMELVKAFQAKISAFQINYEEKGGQGALS
jgi:hypothetical protein